MSIKIIKNSSIALDSPCRITSGTPTLNELAASSPVPDPAKDIVSEALLRESEIIQNAEFEANRIIDAAKDEAASIIDAKIQEGFQNGYEEGRMMAQKETEDGIAKLEEMQLSAREEYINLIKDSEPDIINLVMNISRKFLGDKIEEDKNIITDLVRETILRFTDATELTVRVSSHDYSYVLDNKNNITAKINSLYSLEIVNDDNLNPGSCIVESKDNSVDSSIDKRLDSIQKTFEDLLKYAG